MKKNLVIIFLVVAVLGVVLVFKQMKSSVSSQIPRHGIQQFALAFAQSTDRQLFFNNVRANLAPLLITKGRNPLTARADSSDCDRLELDLISSIFALNGYVIQYGLSEILHDEIPNDAAAEISRLFEKIYYTTVEMILIGCAYREY